MIVSFGDPGEVGAKGFALTQHYLAEGDRTLLKRNLDWMGITEGHDDIWDRCVEAAGASHKPSDPDPKLVERVARAMCKADGNDPDGMCIKCGYQLEHLSGMAKGAQYMPRESVLVPAWVLYAGAAKTAIIELEAAAMEPFVPRSVDEHSVERTPWWASEPIRRAWAAEVARWDAVGSKSGVVHD